MVAKVVQQASCSFLEAVNVTQSKGVKKFYSDITNVII